MRACAGVALSAALCLGASQAPAAVADTYCTIPDCDHVGAGLQKILDAASAHPGPDTILLRPDEHHTVDGVVYSDRGQPGNAIRIFGQTRCEKYGCHLPEISGSHLTRPLVSFTGGGGALVVIEQIRLFPGTATGLELPPGGVARNVTVSGFGVGVELDGTAARPAYLIDSSVSTDYSPVPDNVGVDVPGYAFIVRTFVGGRTAVRASGTGFAEIRGGVLSAQTAFSGTRARVVGTVVDRFVIGQDAPPMVGFEVVCPSARARDAELTLSSVAVLGGNHADETDVRAVGRGGDLVAKTPGAPPVRAGVRVLE